MSEQDGTLEGALVPAPAAEMRYEDEDADRVAKVFVRVDYADGRIREYEATEPQDFTISNPEDMATMAMRTTALSIGSGSGFRGLQALTPSLRLSFSAHPRYNMLIRTERTARPAVENG